MDNVLNLALKKDIFEGLIDGSINTICISKTNWWKKRLMDEDTGKAKGFTIARVSCGSSDKFDYNIKNITLVGDIFNITVENNVRVLENENEIQDNCKLSVFSEEKIENENRIQQFEDIIENIKSEQKKILVTVPVGENIGEPRKTLSELMNNYSEKLEEPNISNVKKKVFDILNNFCSNKNVFVVNSPVVTIRPNGQIMGSKQFFLTGYNETKYTLKSDEIVKLKWMTDEEFVNEIKTTFANILKGNYVFINKNACGFKKIGSGEDAFVINYIARKMYLFNRK